MWKTFGKGVLAMAFTLAMAGTALAAPGGKGDKAAPVAVAKANTVKKAPAKVVVVDKKPAPVKPDPRFLKVLPKRHQVVRFSNERLYLVDGDFYRKARGGYVLTQPPLGARLASLPRGAQRMVIRGTTYARLEGVWLKFDAHRRNFVVVSRPA